MTDNSSSRDDLLSSIRTMDVSDTSAAVLLVIGDGTEVLDTMGPYYRLGEDYAVSLAAPEVDSYNTVIHEFTPGWDVTRELQGYRLESDIAFRDVDPDDYVALVLPGGRAPEYLRYDEDLLRITHSFFEHDKPVASICHGIEILGVAGVLKGRKATTIPKCRFDGRSLRRHLRRRAGRALRQPGVCSRKERYLSVDAHFRANDRGVRRQERLNQPPE